MTDMFTVYLVDDDPGVLKSLVATAPRQGL